MAGGSCALRQSPMAPAGTLVTVILFCGALALAELRIPLFAAGDAGGGRSPANLGLTVVTFLLNWSLESGAAVLALYFSVHSTGLISRLSRPVAVTLSVVVLDLATYVAHVSMHHSSLLWRIHRVHHSDVFVDVTTAFRQHPLEGIWRFAWIIVPILVLGLPLSGVISYRILSAVNALFEHANIQIGDRFDRRLARVWVSPNMHKVHHSRDQQQTDSNYGNILAVFDRLFGTFRPTEEARSIVYGLAGIDAAQGKSLPHLVALPFRKTV